MAASDNRTIVRAIDWLEVFPALRLFMALRLALNFRALVLAAIALVLTTAGWWALGGLFSSPDDVALNDQIAAHRIWPWQFEPAVPRLDDLTSLNGWLNQSPLLRAWHHFTDPFQRLYRIELTFPHFVYLLVGSLWTLLVWAWCGGAITRIAAVAIARQENVSWSQLRRFLVGHWSAYFTAPLFPIMGTFLAAAFLAILGLCMRFDVGVIVAGILWFGVLLGGFTMAFLLIGLFFGWPLMWGAVSAEGTDSFGALSHAYSYTYQRPLHYLAYATIVALAGVLGWFLVSLFAVWIVQLGIWGVSWGSGSARMTEILSTTGADSTLGVGATLIRFWMNCLHVLALAYTFSYLWCASTVIYFLLRRRVDGTEMDEIFGSEEEELHGLPPLKTGRDGVPEVGDDSALENSAAAEEQARP